MSLGSEVMLLMAAERKRRGITQREIAEKLGTSQPYVTKIEKGRCDCSLTTMLRYADAMDMRARQVASIIGAVLEAAS